MELIAHSRVSRHQDMTAAMHRQPAYASQQLYVGVCVIYIVRNLKGALKKSSKKLLYIANRITCIRQDTKSHIWCRREKTYSLTL
jgi:hypothetical protein